MWEPAQDHVCDSRRASVLVLIDVPRDWTSPTSSRDSFADRPSRSCHSSSGSLKTTMKPQTPTRRPQNKHLILGGAVAQDSPLGDLSNALRDTRLDRGKGKAGLGRKDGFESHGKSTSLPVESRVTKDWDGPEAKLKKAKTAGLGPVSGRICCSGDYHGRHADSESQLQYSAQIDMSQHRGLAVAHQVLRFWRMEVAIPSPLVANQRMRPKLRPTSQQLR